MTGRPLPRLQDAADDDVPKPVVRPRDDAALARSLDVLSAASPEGDPLYRDVPLAETTPEEPLPAAAAEYVAPRAVPEGADPTHEVPKVVVVAAPPVVQGEPFRALPAGRRDQTTQRRLPEPVVVGRGRRLALAVITGVAVALVAFALGRAITVRRPRPGAMPLMSPRVLEAGMAAPDDAAAASSEHGSVEDAVTEPDPAKKTHNPKASSSSGLPGVVE